MTQPQPQQDVPQPPASGLQARLRGGSAYDHVAFDPAAGEEGTLRRNGTSDGPFRPVTEAQARWLVSQLSTVNDIEITGIDTGVVSEEQAAAMKRVGVTEIAPGTDPETMKRVLPQAPATRPPIAPGAPPYDDEPVATGTLPGTVTELPAAAGGPTPVPQSPPPPNFNAPLPKDLESKIDG